MKPVKQLIHNGEPNGDCFRACVASILERPVESIPNYTVQSQNDEEFWALNNKWAKMFGYQYVTIYLKESDRHIIKDILCIAAAKSPRREDQYHAVLWLNKMIFDPHPSNDFLAVEPTEFTLLVPFDINCP